MLHRLVEQLLPHWRWFGYILLAVLLIVMTTTSKSSGSEAEDQEGMAFGLLAIIIGAGIWTGVIALVWFIQLGLIVLGL